MPVCHIPKRGVNLIVIECNTHRHMCSSSTCFPSLLRENLLGGWALWILFTPNLRKGTLQGLVA